jgi:hypothetical protein
MIVTGGQIYCRIAVRFIAGNLQSSFLCRAVHICGEPVIEVHTVQTVVKINKDTVERSNSDLAKINMDIFSVRVISLLMAITCRYDVQYDVRSLTVTDSQGHSAKCLEPDSLILKLCRPYVT